MATGQTRITPAARNSCRAYFASGWYLQVSENFVPEGKKRRENLISFRHPFYGTLDAKIEPKRSTYNLATQSAEFWGTGTFRGKRVVVRALVSSVGGFYRRGTTTLQCWEDRNANEAVDLFEPQIFPSSNPISNQQTLMTFAPGESIPPVEE
jgi:hypothetical protein